VFKENSRYKLPDENCKVWKYMDFTKFVSLLEKKALWFSRSDTLRASDKFEGSISLKNIINLFTKLSIIEEFPEPGYTTKDPFRYLKILSRANKFDLQFFFISSFHINEHESAAMWKIYTKNDEGIAIQTTCQSLKQSFDQNDQDEVILGPIKYIDYDSQRIADDDKFGKFFFKRKSFEHESEIRAIIYKVNLSDSTQLREEVDEFDMPYTIEETVSYLDQPEKGFYVTVNLDSFIEKIYIAPTSPEWFKELVISVVKIYGLSEKLVMQSRLDENPIY
jgi:hypothetical protein